MPFDFSLTFRKRTKILAIGLSDFTFFTSLATFTLHGSRYPALNHLLFHYWNYDSPQTRSSQPEYCLSDTTENNEKFVVSSGI